MEQRREVERDIEREKKKGGRENEMESERYRNIERERSTQFGEGSIRKD